MIASHPWQSRLTFAVLAAGVLFVIAGVEYGRYLSLGITLLAIGGLFALSRAVMKVLR